MHVYALFALFHVFIFGLMIVCLDLGLCHVLICFSLYGFVACWSLGPLACLVASTPFGDLFGCNHMWGLKDRKNLGCFQKRDLGAFKGISLFG